jgi:chromosome segregation ATPase
LRLKHEKEYAPEIAMEEVRALKKENKVLEEEKLDLQMRCTQLERNIQVNEQKLREAWQEGSTFEIMCNDNQRTLKSLQEKITRLEAALEAAAANDQGQTAGNTKKRQRRDPRASAKSAGRTSGNSGMKCDVCDNYRTGKSNLCGSRQCEKKRHTQYQRDLRARRKARSQPSASSSVSASP